MSRQYCQTYRDWETRVVDGNNEIPIGSVWTVSKVIGDYIYLDEFGEGNRWLPHKFKLFQDQTQPYNPLVSQIMWVVYVPLAVQITLQH